MKYNCELIRDLLPLCQDNVASIASQAAVNEHLLECAECRSFKKNMETDDFPQSRAKIKDVETIRYTKVAKRIRKRKTLLIACVALIIASVTYFANAYANGKSFDAYTCSQNSHLIDEKSILLSDVDMFPFRIYLYENEDKYRTIVTKYAFPFWELGSGSWANKTDDLVKLVGWCSGKYDEQGITVVPVQCFDEQVAYIEMGTNDRLRKEVKVGEVMIFSWANSLRWNDLDGIAYSKEGEPLYKLGYDNKNATIRTDELRWLPVYDVTD
ncbi:zf-HC2 domain-containing protein [Anaerocolumna sp.]|uniref:zf-HC2 domain-containing protein n=1 Tax=Anaerocolumna sp. TaxID=2041569 RepID=UPI0028AB97CE|nr:zf-HC2 domain-containing protein [Anaerocolumna sp.]